ELSHFEEEKLLVEAVNFIFNTFEKKFLILLENFDLCDFQSLDLIKKISVNNTNCKFLASSVTPKLEKNRIFLKGLAENEVEKILFSIFGDQFLTPKISEKIYKATDGNPLFVLETIKLLVRNDVFFRKNFSWFVDFEKFGSFKFSKRLEGIFSKKIQDFSETESKILTWFSVLNKPAKAEDILFLSELETETFWETLGKLVFSGILKESEKSYKITQEELHRLLYNNLNLMEKREKHIKITFYFEQKKYSEEEIFYHASKGMVFEKMLFYALSLANNYFQVRFFDDSIKLYKTSLETLVFFEPEKALEIIKIWIEKRVTQSNKIILSNWVETLKTFEQKQALIFAKMLIKKFIAMMVLELGNQKEALETYFEILKTAQELDENKQVGGIFSDIAGIYLEQNNFEKAEEFFEKALQTYEKIAFQGGQMLVINNLGAVYLRRNNYTKVLECFEKSLELANKLQNKYFQAVTLVNIAEVLIEFSNDYKKSFANFEKALEIATEIKRSDLVFFVLIAKAKLNFQLGNAKEIELCFEELEKTEAQTPYERFVFLQLKAEKLFFQGETEKAKELCEETIKLGTEKGFDTNESKILLGKIIPDKDEKLKLFNEVFENCAKIQNRILEVSVLCEIAKINNNIKLIDKVYSFGISLKNDTVQAKALIAYGFCYFARKDFELALENLNLAIEGTKFKTLELEILELKFRIFKLTNNQTKLEETGKKLISVAEIFGNKTLRNFVEENLKNESVGSVASSNLGKLLEVISAVNTTKNIDELLALIIDKTLEVTSAERGFLMMKNESGELEFAVARNFNREDLREGSLEISQTTVNQVFKTGKSVFADNIPKDEILSKQGSILDLDLKVILCVPLKIKEQVLGVIYVDSKFSAGILQENQLKLMEAFASQSAIAIENARLYSLLENENKTLKKQLQERFRFGKIIGKSQKMLEVYEKIEILAQRNITVMVNGETGTGKELVAKAIHYESKRKAKPLVILNCAALPETLLESELFGYEKGAFTGATERKKGKFELANEGSIFLDEIGDMPLLTQAKILRVIQEKKFYRLGGEKEIEVDVRIIAATHKNLLETVEKGTFRQDLFYRLNIAKIELPSLRERTEDIPLLVNYFLEKFKKDYEFLRLEITKEALNKLVNYAWPGNIRELENSLEQMAIFSKTGILDVKDLALDFLETESKVQKTDLDFGKVRSYKDIKKAQKDFSDKLQREFFSKLLEKNGGNVAKTAQAAKIARPQLHLILKELGIK
ncbi:sigma 54-interacting transcriptional regulator, partial [bacterium]|nr:sigma 54-interacting transcriptional regulator [bacterium]